MSATKKNLLTLISLGTPERVAAYFLRTLSSRVKFREFLNLIFVHLRVILIAFSGLLLV